MTNAVTKKTDTETKKRIFVPLYYDDYLAGTAALSVEASGALIRLCCHMWTRGGKLDDDGQHLARLVGVTTHKWRNEKSGIRKELIEAGKLQADDGKIWSRRALIELENVKEKQIKNSNRAATASNARWHGQADADSDSRGGDAVKNTDKIPEKNQEKTQKKPEKNQENIDFSKGKTAEIGVSCDASSNASQRYSQSHIVSGQSDTLPTELDTNINLLVEAVCKAARLQIGPAARVDFIDRWTAAGATAFDITNTVNAIYQRQQQRGAEAPASLAYYNPAINDLLEKRQCALSAGRTAAAALGMPQRSKEEEAALKVGVNLDTGQFNGAFSRKWALENLFDADVQELTAQGGALNDLARDYLLKALRMAGVLDGGFDDGNVTYLGGKG